MTLRMTYDHGENAFLNIRCHQSYFDSMKTPTALYVLYLFSAIISAVSEGTKLGLRLPKTYDVSEKFNHDLAGRSDPRLLTTTSTKHSEPWWPEIVWEGWRRRVYRQRLAAGGKRSYDRVKRAILEWTFDAGDLGMYGLDEDTFDKKLGPVGKRFITFARFMGCIWVTNPVRVAYNAVDEQGPDCLYTSSAYTTCDQHWLKGEERMTVFHRTDDNVDVEILSHSKPAFHLIWPFIGRTQDKFFRKQMKSLVDTGENETVPVRGRYSRGTGFSRPRQTAAKQAHDTCTMVTGGHLSHPASSLKMFLNSAMHSVM